jgi:hypothetical protein
MLAILRAEVDAGNIEVVTPTQFLALAGQENLSAVTTPSRVQVGVGASPYDLYNTAHDPVLFAVTGGTVSSITRSSDGSTFDATGVTAGEFVVMPGDRLRITYTVAPTVLMRSVSA